MTPNDHLDRRLTAWLEGESAPRARQGAVDAFAERVPRTRQLPSWATTERWISMETRAQLGTVSRAAVMLATLALLAALTAGAIVVGSSTTTKLPEPFGPASNGLIAYAAQGDIWLVTVDGETTRLTSGPGFAQDPAWSYDGTRIAYTAMVDGAYDVIVANADGSDAVTVAGGLTVDPGVVDPDPGIVTWNPDGSAVMFDLVDGSVDGGHCGDAFASSCGSRIWLAAADGSSLEQIGPAELDAANPSWSPDGSTIAFAGRLSDGSDEQFGLFLMDADGSNVHRLGDLSGPPPGRAFYWISWSPDGTRIATDGIPNTVYVVDVQTGEVTAAAAGPMAGHANWSPDGTELAVSNWNVGGIVIDETGTERTVDDVPVGGMHWSPDGTMLVGWSEQPEAIYLLDLDGHLLSTIEAPFIGTGHIDFQRLAP